MASNGDRRPTLAVEVLLRDDLPVPTVSFGQIRDEVEAWILYTFVSLETNSPITGFDKLAHSHLIESIDVVEACSMELDTLWFDLDACQLQTQVYSFNKPAQPSRLPRSVPRPVQDEAATFEAMAQVTALPDRKFQHEWNLLTYMDQVHVTLLNHITGTMSLTRKSHTQSFHLASSRAVLLHGPPGSGKTTLCRALAQKAAIRLKFVFPAAKLLEIKTSNLLTRWFGESGKHVSALFNGIVDIAAKNDTLVLVLLDEVESIVSSRKASAAGGDHRDGVRATNEMLKGLDRLRGQDNVFVLSTSNLVEDIDSAFLDRINVQRYIPNVELADRYEVLRSALIGLQHAGMINAERTTYLVNADAPSVRQNPQQLCGENIPTYADACRDVMDEPTPYLKRMWNISQASKGLSGRYIHDLASTSLTMYAYHGCSLGEALGAIERRMDDDDWKGGEEWFKV